jgi:hypothetical protein
MFTESGQNDDDSCMMLSDENECDYITTSEIICPPEENKRKRKFFEENITKHYEEHGTHSKFVESIETFLSFLLEKLKWDAFHPEQEEILTLLFRDDFNLYLGKKKSISVIQFDSIFVCMCV